MHVAKQEDIISNVLYLIVPSYLEYFEYQCKSAYVRVIATARNEQEPDKEGELSPWEKLQWEKYELFWGHFNCYSLGEPSVGAVVSLLTDCVLKFGMQGNLAEYEQIAQRNDGTFRNITLNLNRAKSRGLVINNQDFSPRLDETWRQRYNKLVNRDPLAVYVYNAVELLRNLNLLLTVPLLEATTRCLLPGWGLRRWSNVWQLQPTLRYLVDKDNILRPKDGQIEGKNTKAVDVGRYVLAILQALDTIGKRYPDYPVATECFNCGNTLNLLGRYEEAIASYDKAIQFKPDYHEAWNSRGNVLGVLERYEEAIASFEKALKIKPDYHVAWYNRGIALDNLGRKEEAIASYDKAVEIKPDKHEAWFYRGNVLGVLERYEEAIASYEKALEIKPDYHEAWFYRGLALTYLHRYQEALLSYDKALEIQPDFANGYYNANLYYNKACYYGLQKNTDLAIENLQQAITLDSKWQESAKNDSDFDSIRDDERFQALI